jgi:hypothetical protein
MMSNCNLAFPLFTCTSDIGIRLSNLMGIRAQSLNNFGGQNSLLDAALQSRGSGSYSQDGKLKSAQGGSRTRTILRSLDFESSASASSATRAWLADIKRKFGGPNGDRTRDLHNAIVALSQLSYRPNIPICFNQSFIAPVPTTHFPS